MPYQEIQEAVTYELSFREMHEPKQIPKELFKNIAQLVFIATYKDMAKYKVMSKNLMSEIFMELRNRGYSYPPDEGSPTREEIANESGRI